MFTPVIISSFEYTYVDHLLNQTYYTRGNGLNGRVKHMILPVNHTPTTTTPAPDNGSGKAMTLSKTLAATSLMSITMLYFAWTDWEVQLVCLCVSFYANITLNIFSIQNISSKPLSWHSLLPSHPWRWGKLAAPCQPGRPPSNAMHIGTTCRLRWGPQTIERYKRTLNFAWWVISSINLSSIVIKLPAFPGAECSDHCPSIWWMSRTRLSWLHKPHACPETRNFNLLKFVQTE